MNAYPEPILPPGPLRLNFKKVSLEAPDVHHIVNPLARLLDYAAARIFVGAQIIDVNATRIDRIAIMLTTRSFLEIPAWSIGTSSPDQEGAWPMLNDPGLTGEPLVRLLTQVRSEGHKKFGSSTISINYTALCTGLSNHQRMALEELGRRNIEDAL